MDIHRPLKDDPKLPGVRARALLEPRGCTVGNTVVDDYSREVRPLFAPPRRTFQRTLYGLRLRDARRAPTPRGSVFARRQGVAFRAALTAQDEEAGSDELPITFRGIASHATLRWRGTVAPWHTMETPVDECMSRAFQAAGTVLAEIVGSASMLKHGTATTAVPWSRR